MAAVLITSCGGIDPEKEVTGIELDTTTLELVIKATYTLKATVLPDYATNKSVTWTSSDASIASVANGIVTANAQGTATITAKAGNYTATCAVTVEGVLINGVVWAAYNVGSTGIFVSNPEDYGEAYQWNRKENTNFLLLGDYMGSSYQTSSSWLPENNPCPTGWRVPTRDEFLSLLDVNRVSNEWTTLNGKNGRRFTDIGTGKSIFLPAAGYRSSLSGSVSDVGTRGHYSCGTQFSDFLTNNLNFSNADIKIGDIGKADGLSVRPVAK